MTDRRLLKDEAYDALRAAIVSGDLEPGTTLSDADLADRLGVSRAPVRAALARLVDDGLVETKPQSFTRVTPVVDREVRDAVQVVRAMHELVVGLAVPLVTPEDIADMAIVNTAFTDAIRAGDVEAALDADDAFHDIPVRVARNRPAAATIERFTPLIRRLERTRVGGLPGHESVRLHARLLRAFREGDVALAVSTTTQIWGALEQQLDVPASDVPPAPETARRPRRAAAPR